MSGCALDALLPEHALLLLGRVRSNALLVLAGLAAGCGKVYTCTPFCEKPAVDAACQRLW